MRRMLRFAIAIPLVALYAASSAASPCRDQEPADSTVALAPAGEPGTRMRLTGTAYDAAAGRPLAGVTLYVYQTDANGYYSANRGMDNRNPRLCGVLRTGRNGGYTVETIRPADYATGGVEAHVHIEAWGAGVPRQGFLLQFEDEVRVLAAGARPPAPRGRAAGVAQPLYRHTDGTLEVRRDLPIRR